MEYLFQNKLIPNLEIGTYCKSKELMQCLIYAGLVMQENKHVVAERNKPSAYSRDWDLLRNGFAKGTLKALSRREASERSNIIEHSHREVERRGNLHVKKLNSLNGKVRD